MKLSILTATYNREKYLKRLYESIKENIKDTTKINYGNNNIEGRGNTKNSLDSIEIEWIIIDDGSIDNTKNNVLQWQNEVVNNYLNFEIKYFFQENSGKMQAINRGVQASTGNVIVDCDSDDYFSKNAFNIIKQNFQMLAGNNELYALCFLKQDTKGNISGKKFKKNYSKSTMFDLYFKDEIEGEKILVFNSDIRKKYKHELEKNEKFVTEARMYHKMDEKYKILCINESIEIGEYIEDGYTKNIVDTFYKYPNGYYKYFKEILKKGLKGVTIKKRLYVIKHFLLFAILKFSIGDGSF